MSWLIFDWTKSDTNFVRKVPHTLFLNGDRIMSEIENRLHELGLTLPPPKDHVANYLGSKRFGNLLFVSGRVSQLRGEVGSEVSLSEAQEAAQSALLDILAIIKEDIGELDQIVSVEKLVGFVRSSQLSLPKTRGN